MDDISIRLQESELGIERIREPAPHPEEIGYRVDDLIVDVRRQDVVRGDEKIALSPLSYDLLLALLRAAPKLVSPDELMNRVWPGLVVSPETVSQRVKLVRHALGDNAASPRYIAGVRGRGYRLIAPVQALDRLDSDPNGADLAKPAPPFTGSTEAPAAQPVQPEVSNPRPPIRNRGLLRRVAWPTIGLLAAAVLVYATAGQALWDRVAVDPPAAVTEPAGNSVAVLPFVNLSGDPASEHFSDGLSEEILHRLARTRGLRVLARTSSFAYKDSGIDVQQLGDLLSVRYLLEGSVRREGQYLRVTARLVDDSGFRVWSGSYDREIRDVFDIQDEIAASVAANIFPHIAVVPKRQAHPDVRAYEHYLIGREILRKRLQDSDVMALQEVERAVEIDPNFAEARAELAIALTFVANWKGIDTLDGAQAEIDAALSINPDLARAHAAQGLLLLSRHKGYAQPLAPIKAALRRAIALDPNMVDARNWLAGVLHQEGRYAEARAELERAARIDPLAPTLNANLAADFVSQGDFAEAERRLKRVLDVPQPSIMIWLDLGELYFTTGRLVQSNELAKQLAWRGVDTGRVSNQLLVTSYARLGMWDAAEYWQDRIDRESAEASMARKARQELLRLQGRYAQAAAELGALLESRGTQSAAGEFVLRSGTLQALAGDYSAAIAALKPASLAGFTPADFGIDAGHALAWAYQQTGAPERARPILKSLEEFFLAVRANDRLHGSDMRYQFAQNAVLAGEHDLAIERLTQAVDAGWRDYYRLLHDPRWQSVRGNPRFQGLVATVKADIDRQRKQVEQAERAEEFVASIDAAVAARRQ